MKQFTIACAIFAIFLSNGCIITGQKAKESKVIEPTLNSKTNNPEIISSDVEVIGNDIEVIEMNDTTGRVTAAREAASKLISDAKNRAKEITKSAETIYEIKKEKADQNAATIIKEATLKAQKNAKEIVNKANRDAKELKSKTLKESLKKSKESNKKIISKVLEAKSKSAKKDQAKVTADIVKEKSAFKKSILKEKANLKKSILKGEAKISKTLADLKKTSKKIINNAKKSAADITKLAGKKAKQLKNESKKILTKAKEYAKISKKEADTYLTKKMKEADKAVSDFTKKLEDKKAKEKKEAPKDTNAQVATVMLDKLLAAIPTNNYTEFSKDFTVDLKKRFTKEKFIQTNKVLNEKLGKCTNKTYMGNIQKGPLNIYIWKGNFEKLTKNNELVIRMTLGELDKKLQVFAFDISMM